MGSKPLRKSEVRRSITGSLNSANGTRQDLVPTSFNHYKQETTTKVPKNSLTPLSRLKRFKKLRDKNLRKEVLGRGLAKQSLNMLESGEEIHVSTKEKPIKGSPVKDHDILNNGNSYKSEENGLNGIEEEPEEVISNGLENGHKEEETSPRRSTRNKAPSPSEVPQAKEEDEVKESSETEEEVDVENEKEEEELEIEQPLKVFRRSFRHSQKSISPEEPGPSNLEDEIPSRYTPDYTESEVPRLGYRISGRRPIRRNITPTGSKRKADTEVEESPNKRMAYTPSVSSPGWRFFSSPFTRFWPRTPGQHAVNDSMVVNVSTDSEVSMSDIDLNQTEEIIDIETPTPDPPLTPNKSSWVCSVM